MKKIIRLLRITLKVITCVVLALLVLSAFSHWISPYRSIWFSYLGLFFPFILAGSVGLLILNLIFAQWKQSIAMLVVFLICSGSIFSYFAFNRRSKEVPADCIKILTYNVMTFNYLRAHKGDKINEIVKYVADNDADIICFQEYSTSTEKGLLTLEDLKRVLPNTPYYHIEKLNHAIKTRTTGLAIFSKYPILKTKKIDYGSKYNGSFIAELDIDGRRVTLINNHLESNGLTIEERTEYDGLTKDPNMTELKSFTQMMFKRLTPAYKARALQAQQVRKAIDEADTPYIIVCGDFNDTPISYARHKIKGNLKDAFAESGRGMGVTYNRYNFRFRIDYILYSNNIKSYNCEIGKLEDSDHYPVSTYLQFVD